MREYGAGDKYYVSWSSNFGYEAIQSGLPCSHKQKRPDQALKKSNSTEKSQIRDKHTMTLLKHPNALLKGNMYTFYA